MVTPNDPRFVLLRKLPGFASFTDEELAQLADLLTERRVHAGQPLFSVSEPPDACFLVAQGKLRLVLPRDGKVHALGDLTPGDLVGHVAMLDKQPHPVTCQAAVNTRTYELKRASFDALIWEGGSCGHKLVDLMTGLLVRQLRIANHNLGHLAQSEQQAAQPRSPEDPAVQTVFKRVARQSGVIRLDFDPLRA